jgi:hypothetical protein
MHTAHVAWATPYRTHAWCHRPKGVYPLYYLADIIIVICQINPRQFSNPPRSPPYNNSPHPTILSPSTSPNPKTPKIRPPKTSLNGRLTYNPIPIPTSLLTPLKSQKTPRSLSTALLQPQQIQCSKSPHTRQPYVTKSNRLT